MLTFLMHQIFKYWCHRQLWATASEDSNSMKKQPHFDPNFLFSTFFVLFSPKDQPQFKVERKRETVYLIDSKQWSSLRFHIVLPREALAQAGPSHSTHERWTAGPSRTHTPMRMQTGGQRTQAWPPSLPSTSGPNNVSSVRPTLTILFKVVMTTACLLGTSALAPTSL